MQVEVWLDFVCPYCYIGKRHLELASEDMPFKDEIEIIYHSFELDSHAPVNHEHADIHSLLAQKAGVSQEEAKTMNDEVSQLAASVGLDYHFDTMIPTNTFDAHRLAHFAKEKGKSYQFAERLFHAYFTESQDLSDYDTLARLAGEIGLSSEESLKVLNDGKYSYAVRRDEKSGTGYGLTGVPFFVINHKYSIAGAQPVDTFQKALQQVYAQEKAKAR